jgi:hypothetical protein
LAVPSGGQTLDPEEMLQTCHDFYKDLFTEPAPSPDDTQQMLDILRSVPKKVTTEMNTRLRAPIELGELEQAMKAMANEKAPGPDGVVIEFFKLHWKVVGADYLTMLKQSMDAGMFPTLVLRGLITLFHKGGHRLPLGNYRPITLLICTYKIYAKLLQ